MKTLRLILLAVLTALPALATTVPNGSDVPNGSPLTFTVTVSTGTPPFSYQWKKDGTTIAGATSVTYSIAAVTSADVGVYTCAVTNKAGATLSDTAVFTITAIPGGVHVSMSTP